MQNSLQPSVDTIDPNTSQKRSDGRHVTVKTDGGRSVHVYLDADNTVKGESVGGQLDPVLSVGSYQYNPSTTKPRPTHEYPHNSGVALLS
jgi:hypothetical protein